MPVDPVIQSLLDTLEAMGGVKLAEGTPGQARRAFRTLTVDMRQPDQVVEVGDVADLEVPGGDGTIPARVYRPLAGERPAPTVLFVHGGGFVIGDLDTHDNQARRLCAGIGAVVVSIDYRRAPEHPWPAAVDDTLAAFRWLVDTVDRFGGDPDRIGVAGDSAGGNLSAVVAVTARDEGLPLAAQLLIYPGVDFHGERPSRDENAEGYFMTADDLEWFARHYLGLDADDERPEDEVLRHPQLSPVHADLRGVAPAVVVTAEYDPLRDDGDAFVAALRDAGVAVDHLAEPDLIHGFFDMFTFSPAARAAVDRAVDAFAARLDRG